MVRGISVIMRNCRSLYLARWSEAELGKPAPARCTDAPESHRFGQVGGVIISSRDRRPEWRESHTVVAAGAIHIVSKAG